MSSRKYSLFNRVLYINEMELVWIDDNGYVRKDVDNPDAELVCVQIHKPICWVIDIINKRISAVHYDGELRKSGGTHKHTIHDVRPQIKGWEDISTKWSKNGFRREYFEQLLETTETFLKKNTNKYYGNE